MTFGPNYTDLYSSPKERQLQKSCVSFGEECISHASQIKTKTKGMGWWGGAQCIRNYTTWIRYYKKRQPQEKKNYHHTLILGLWSHKKAKCSPVVLWFDHVNIVKFLSPFNMLMRHPNNIFSVIYVIIGAVKPIKLSTVREQQMWL